MRRARSLHTSRRASVVALDPGTTWDVVASGEAGPQWYVDAAPLVVRRWIDRLALGPALRREPPGRPHLATGDEVGFWKVVEADHQTRRLVLVAQVRSPGRVTLEVAAQPHADGTEVELAVTLSPRGLVGRAYELVDLPAREAVSELLVLHLLTVLRRHDNPWAASSVDQV
ncbi:DUF2867 domain-containing protein [Nocardioides sp.]|uniref:DUF2867 domain-containing protein n=1 Tax=Nocardioides sp. TaxID=35761 RepID=UPI00271AB1F3|nr:DUF2867 domain-containing protein [Nocardioides sp.]MDO9458037.1 DUF2867 domain-containing protein [Nocardioides sp.]